MKVLLVGPDHEENLSIRYLSASLLAAGHDTALAAFNSAADTGTVAEAAQQADLVGLSMCFQSRAREFLALARLIKSRQARKLIVAGGHYASCAAEPLLANHAEIDMIVIHEGESTLAEIADAMSGPEKSPSRIPGLGYREEGQVRFSAPRPMRDDLDALPFPDRRGPIHFIAGVPTSYLMGSRGCYGSCAYCCITTLHRMAPGKRFRQRRVERIADEMAALYHERRTRQFVFHDDNFLVPSRSLNHARLSAFEKALKSRRVEGIALVMKCRPADADRQVLRRLKDLGLVRLFLGVESATPRGLSALERSQSVEDSERALAVCAELDISAQFTLMTFHPDATSDTLRSDAAFLRRFCENPLNFCRAEIYAGTPLEQRMIALGRTRGDYLAREYSLSDPAADLACRLSLDLFDRRCWNSGSLMQSAIGLDHMAAVLKRLYAGPQPAALGRRIAAWVRSVNLNTIGLLDEVIELGAGAAGHIEAIPATALLDLKTRESASCDELFSAGESLRAELEALRFPAKGSRLTRVPTPRLRLARQVAAALLAIGVPAASASHPAVGQEIKAPPKASAPDQQSLCTLAGTVTDPSGAVIANAAIIITNLETGAVRSLKTDQEGRYLANDLPAGRYTVRAQASNFTVTEKAGVVLKAGGQERADFVLKVADWGCCEYAAAPLQAPEELTARKKPFTYVVGEAADQNTLQGIAKLVYGDSKAWVSIFEANRGVLPKPAFIPNGTSLFIPPKKRKIPKLITRVIPAYPAGAQKEHLLGDVVMDVTLNDNGTVARVDLIDGQPLLAEAATNAVKQWRYQPLFVQGKPVAKFVVVISFGKGGKIR